MNTLKNNLQQNVQTVKKALPSEDVLTYSFATQDGVACALVYADGLVNKQLLGELIARPFSFSQLCSKTQKNNENTEKDGGRYEMKEQSVMQTAQFPELKIVQTLGEAVQEVLDGNSLLLVDGLPTLFIVGAKLVPVRTITEPPTDIAVKGPREGFIEDIKTNMALVRKRLKTPDLRFETLRVGKRSDTAVSLCWLQGIANDQVKEEIKQKLQQVFSKQN